MSGFYLVCGKRSDGSKCTMTFSADSKEELLDKALEHMSSAHGIKRTRGLEDQLKAGMKKTKHVA